MNILDGIRKNSIFNSFKEINKAYTEGVYADTPTNRKLGRVGMSYVAYAEKVKKEEKNNTKDESKKISYFGTNVDESKEEKELKETKAISEGSDFYSFDNSFLKSSISVYGINSSLGIKYGRRFYIPKIEEIKGEKVNIPYSEDEMFTFKTRLDAENWIKDKVKDKLKNK